MKRNSGSPADGDYLGQLKFKGENDADQEVIYAKMTGKISDASDGTEDGLLEFMLKKAGSNNIGARLTSTNLDLLNGTGLTVDGAVTISSGVNVLVGTTDTTLYNNTTGTGTKLGGDGRLDVARQADTVATFNRTGSSDGEIIRIVSSGTTIGAIGSVSGDIALTSIANPIRFTINNSEKFRFAAAGQLGVGGANYGTSGQVLTSGGDSAAPTWADAAGGGGLGYSTNTTILDPPGTADTDLGNLTDSDTDAFGVQSTASYDLMDPRGQTVSLDLGAL